MVTPPRAKIMALALVSIRSFLGATGPEALISELESARFNIRFAAEADGALISTRMQTDTAEEKQLGSLRLLVEVPELLIRKFFISK